MNSVIVYLVALDDSIMILTDVAKRATISIPPRTKKIVSNYEKMSSQRPFRIMFAKKVQPI